jgi:hypothetical protein
MKHNDFVFRPCTLILLFLNLWIAPTFGQSKTKLLPQYHCQMTLPAGAWEWNDDYKDKNTPTQFFIGADSNKGLSFLLTILRQSKEQIMDAENAARFEKGYLEKSGLKKISGKIITFQGVSCYELEMETPELNMNAYSRIFIAYRYLYAIQYIVPKQIRMTPANLDRLFGGFKLTGKINADANKAAIDVNDIEVEPLDANEKKETTSPDDPIYRIKNKGTEIQLQIAKHNLVTVNPMESSVFFSIKTANMPTSGFASNIAGEVFIQVFEYNYENAAKEWKQKQIDNDNLLVKEMKGSQTKGINSETPSSLYPCDQTILLFTAGSAFNGKPCSYQGLQCIQCGDCVVQIFAKCEKGMKMNKQDTDQLNQILLSSLRSIRINSKPVDTELLVGYLKKKQ